MKYKAVFDVPENHGIGCAYAKIIDHGLEKPTEKDFKTIYANTEPVEENNRKTYRVFLAADTIELQADDVLILSGSDNSIARISFKNAENYTIAMFNGDQIVGWMEVI